MYAELPENGLAKPRPVANLSHRMLRLLKGFALLIGVGSIVSVAWVLHKPAKSNALDLSGPGCLVLAYHRVLPLSTLFSQLVTKTDGYTIAEEMFERQIRSLKASGAQFIKPAQLESILKRRSAPPENCVLVTLDDGDISQYLYAFPALKREQIPFTLFLISGQIGASTFNGMEMMTWQQVREMVESGLVTLGSHTHNMHELGQSQQAVFLTPPEAARFASDLQTSIAAIQKEIGVTPEYFAYPFGFGTPDTDASALRLKMHLLFSLREGLARPGDASFFVKRVMITEDTDHIINDWAAIRSHQKTKLLR